MGAVIVVVSAAGAVLVAFLLRTALPGPVVFAALAACGGGIAWGGMLLRPDPSPGEVAAAVVVLAVLVPFHVRVVLGPLGPKR